MVADCAMIKSDDSFTGQDDCFGYHRLHRRL